MDKRFCIKLRFIVDRVLRDKKDLSSQKQHTISQTTQEQRQSAVPLKALLSQDGINFTRDNTV